MSIERKYSDSIRARAVARVIERRKSEPKNRSIVREVAEEMGVGEQSLRNWLSRLSDGEFVKAHAEPIPLTGRSTSAGRSAADLAEQVRALQEENAALRLALVALSREVPRSGTKGFGATA